MMRFRGILPAPSAFFFNTIPLLPLLLLINVSLTAQTVPADRWSITTRWDYRVKIDGRYIGHADRELREVYRKTGIAAESPQVEGEARFLGQTRKNGVPVAARLDAADEVSFVLNSDGQVPAGTGAFPSLKGFPALPDGELHPGDTWESPMESIVLGPANQAGSVPVLASYRYVADKPYMDRDAAYLEVQWALRYRGEEGALQEYVQRADGVHKVTLVLDRETLEPIMARDSFRETWQWTDSRAEEREGFALIFWAGVKPLEKQKIRADVEKKYPDVSGDFVYTETPAGLSIATASIHFQPDLAVVLPEDLPLIDLLAEILKGIPNRTVIVRGHTADLGRPDDQYRLSEQRARTIAAELAARGIDPRRLVYEGAGADEPVSSNDTEEGRALNRRVEFLILED
jgi:outer membrane protein OmpA-like peptidoglycan-associated protein